MKETNRPPEFGTFGLPEAKIIYPGDRQKSVLYWRLKTGGGDRMPPLGVTLHDQEALDILGAWIDAL